jgi:hypothetical protein
VPRAHALNRGQPGLSAPVGAMTPTAIGQYAGQTVVQAPTEAVGRELLRGLTDQPGIRLGGTSGKGRVYYGTSYSPQRFTQPAPVNRGEALQVAAIKSNQRNSLAKKRGAPTDRGW